MIQIARKAAVAIPDILQNRGAQATAVLIERYEKGEREFSSKTDFTNDIYGDDTVKDALRDAQSHKCCFCESKISHISYGDVEHYRPKAGWVQDNEKMNKPGYYWLAYNWDNLLLSCQLCNQRYKKNYFPLSLPANRATSHQTDINTEAPLFLHPVLDNPADYITFREDVPVAIDSNERGTVTIERLGLNREKLNDQRRDVLGPIRDIYNLAKGCPDTNPAYKEHARTIANKYYQESLDDSTQYAAMKRAFFQQNPIEDL